MTLTTVRRMLREGLRRLLREELLKTPRRESVFPGKRLLLRLLMMNPPMKLLTNPRANPLTNSRANPLKSLWKTGMANF